MNEDVKEFFGCMLMIIGGLFALLTGGCGLVFILSTFAGSGPLPIHATPGSTSIIERLQISGSIFLLSGVPCLIGYVFFRLGKDMLPSGNNKTQDKKDSNEQESRS